MKLPIEIIDEIVLNTNDINIVKLIGSSYIINKVYKKMYDKVIIQLKERKIIYCLDECCGCYGIRKKKNIKITTDMVREYYKNVVGANEEGINEGIEYHQENQCPERILFKDECEEECGNIASRYSEKDQRIYCYECHDIIYGNDTLQYI